MENFELTIKREKHLFFVAESEIGMRGSRVWMDRCVADGFGSVSNSECFNDSAPKIAQQREVEFLCYMFSENRYIGAIALLWTMSRNDKWRAVEITLSCFAKVSLQLVKRDTNKTLK